jgi:nucleoside-diphosphate-sugar epimerase
MYLVTGIAGFIGSSIAKALVARGERVRGIDNFITGKRENLADLQGVEVIEGDISERAACARACAGVTYVFHEAALASVPRSVERPLESNQSNVDGTVQLLDCARAAGVKRVVYAGSSSAYGDSPTLPKHEEMLPRPMSPYAVSKLAAEYYLNAFNVCYGLETVTIRYFNVFGPHQDPSSMYSGVLARFITQMLRGEQPTIFGDGEQTRDFTYIENVVQANLLACAAPAGAVAGKVFNVATGQSYSLNQTFDLLCKITGYKGRPRYEPERSGDIKHSVADISRAQRALNYKVLVGFEEGLRRTVEWYRATAAPAMVKPGAR